MTNACLQKSIRLALVRILGEFQKQFGEAAHVIACAAVANNLRVILIGNLDQASSWASALIPMPLTIQPVDRSTLFVA
jgi:hypothetical protein